MKLKNRMKLEIAARSENERFARSAVAAFVAGEDPTLEEISDLRCALSEAVTNAIVHGYRGREGGKVYIEVKVYEERVITLKVKDTGVGIADIEQAMQPCYTEAPEEERGGMGFTIMQTFTDGIRVRSGLGKGTTVVMKKRFK